MAVIQMLFPAVFYVAASFLADWGKSLLKRSFQMAGFVFYHIICALAVLAFCFMYFRMGMSENTGIHITSSACLRVDYCPSRFSAWPGMLRADQ